MDKKWERKEMGMNPDGLTEALASEEREEFTGVFPFLDCDFSACTY